MAQGIGEFDPDWLPQPAVGYKKGDDAVAHHHFFLAIGRAGASRHRLRRIFGITNTLPVGVFWNGCTEGWSEFKSHEDLGLVDQIQPIFFLGKVHHRRMVGGRP